MENKIKIVFLCHETPNDYYLITFDMANLVTEKTTICFHFAGRYSQTKICYNTKWQILMLGNYTEN